MTAETKRSPPGHGEFVARTALMISLVALSIDAMLPALAEIGADLGARHANDAQLVVTALFVGLAIGQMVYGPLSDSIGRKPAAQAGLALFIVGCVLSMVATTFAAMLLGRLLQGLGAAGPRIVLVALVRDGYQGRAMARIMSMVMAVFILVPVIAPAIGQGILLIAAWRAIFGFFLAVAVIVAAWFALRQPETLPPARRVPFSLGQIARGIVATLGNRVALGYTITAGLIFGAFVSYLTSGTQILQIQYGLGDRFPLYFGALSVAIGAASLLNSRLVMRYGMRRLASLALWALTGLSLPALAVAFALAGHPPLVALMTYLSVAFFCMGILFGNFNAMAMEPLGDIAGVGAAVVGSLTTFVSLSLGTLIGQAYDGTVLPMIAGFASLGLAALATMRWTERGRQGG